MRFTQHSSNNRILTPPGDRDDVSPLPVTHVIDPSDGTCWHISYWRPTPQEIEQLANGATVALFVMGSAHPPVALEVETTP